MQYTSKYSSRLGEMLLASDGKNLTGIWFLGQKYCASNLGKDNEEKELPIFEQTKKWLDIYFTGKAPNFTLPLSFDGVSSFRKRVWQVLLEIPFGDTSTYGEITKRIERETGKRVSAQAVGGAVGHNTFAIIVPCHRVLGRNKSLTGYAGGIDKKIKLLKIEGIDVG